MEGGSVVGIRVQCSTNVVVGRDQPESIQHRIPHYRDFIIWWCSLAFAATGVQSSTKNLIANSRTQCYRRLNSTRITILIFHKLAGVR